MASNADAPVSFSFVKKSKQNLKKTSTKDEPKGNDDIYDYVSTIEGKEVHGIGVTKEEKKELIIPMIETNRWRAKTKLPVANKKAEVGNEEIDNNTCSTIESLAVKELIEDAARQQEEFEECGRMDKNMAIPLLMKNKVPEGFESDEKLDVSLRPDEPEEADYERIPIEQFGVAMLRGMGWKDGEGIGKNKKNVAPIEAILRPKGLGLGASAAALDNKYKKNQSKDAEEEELKMVKGTYCLIQSGKHKDLYGQIEGLDEDNVRAVIKLTISSQNVTVSQYSIKLVDKSDYQKHSKYINKSKADRYKANEEEKAQNGNTKKRSHKSASMSDSSSDDGQSKHHRKKRSTDRSVRKRDGDRHKHSHRRKDDDSRNKESDVRWKEDYERTSSKSRDTKNSENKLGSSYKTNDHRHIESKLWVQPQLNVRIVDKSFKNGKYYNAKVEVIDVIDEKNCICKHEGRLLEGVPQSVLETVVPKSKQNKYVMIVTGSNNRQVAEILDKDKSKQTCTVQLLRDREKILTLHLDSLCEYLGDIDTYVDY